MSEEFLHRYCLDVLSHKHYCPNCKASFSCPCKHCDKSKKSKWSSFDGETLTCLSCGYTESYDTWMDIEADQLLSVTRTDSLTDAIERMSKIRKHQGLISA